ncbi:ArsA-related P-loop ATPase [Desulfomicrobium escambiense]|uniref:ATP-binding protein n=1 Tax=Desulfomicrobium escambiense TaxID=29503 RepID=UPI00040FD2C0|nr:ArsA-related P-loop ATPase [Desulfomicrobium escambiense]
MKIAFAGKGGVGKTTLCAWLGDYLARNGHDVILVDADTALSLGQASGLDAGDLPDPLSAREDLIRERIGSGFLSLNPDVSDLPDELSVNLPVAKAGNGRTGTKRLLTMGSITGAGDGCACAANALLKSVLAHLMLRERSVVLVDLEAGVEHLGRGTVEGVDGLVVVSEPSRRSLETAARVGALAAELGLSRQVLAVNRGIGEPRLPDLQGLPSAVVHVPALASLTARQLDQASVLGLEDGPGIDAVCARLMLALS